MNRQNDNTPNVAQQAAPVLATPLPSDRLYQFAALTVIIFLLATML